MTAAYVILVVLGMAILLLAAWWRYASSIPPWNDDEPKESHAQESKTARPGYDHPEMPLQAMPGIYAALSAWDEAKKETL